MNCIVLPLTFVLGALAGAYIVKNNYAKSLRLLTELQRHAEEGTEQAKVIIMAKLDSHFNQ